MLAALVVDAHTDNRVHPARLDAVQQQQHQFQTVERAAVELLDRLSSLPPAWGVIATALRLTALLEMACPLMTVCTVRA
jgi:flagellar motor component MotA